MENVSSFMKRVIFRTVVTDSFSFRLHYKLTFAILLGLSVVVGWKHHFGNPINCMTKGFLPGLFVDDFCYVHSTYSIHSSWNKKFGIEVPYPGVDRDKDQKKVYHTYYQWVSMMLFIQAILFLVPKCFWDHMESGRVQNIVKDMAKYNLDNSNKRQLNIKDLTRRLRSELHKNRKYFLSYIMAGVFNLVNVVVQIQLMNVFLRGEFKNLGTSLMSSEDWSWISNKDPGLKLFPRAAMCDLYNFGSSGDVQKSSTMCLLPINALNEKIYAFLWFWLFNLISVSCFALVDLLLFCVSFRFRIYSIMAVSRLVQKDDLKSIVCGCNVADCFLIQLVAQNISPETFKDVVESIILENSKKMEIELTTV